METKKVSLIHAVGIVFLPFIFSWFTLRKGYSTLARIVSIGWMLVLVSGVMLPANRNNSNTNSDTKNNWVYSTEQDERTQEITYMSMTKALYADTVDKMPIETNLWVAKPQNDPVLIAVRVNFARFYCPRNKCTVDVSFDGVKESYKVISNSDYKVIQIIDAKRFNKKLLKSKKLQLTVKFNNYTSATNPHVKRIMFNVENLKYPAMYEK